MAKFLLNNCFTRFNGTFLLPPGEEAGQEAGRDPAPGPLPGCFTADSREGFHLTYYWFYLQQWPGMPHTLSGL